MKSSKLYLVDLVSSSKGKRGILFLLSMFVCIGFFYSPSFSHASGDIRCIKTILTDYDLDVKSSREASRICSNYTMREVLCAQRLDNEGIEDNFHSALEVCERPRHQVSCIELILTDYDLDVKSSREASRICSNYTMREVLCAQRLDNEGIENNFNSCARGM